MTIIPQVRRIIFNDEEIGMGFNSQTGLAVGTALEGFTVGTPPEASGQEVTASIDMVNSYEQMMESLGMSFEAQGRYGFVSGSAKATFAENSNYNSTSTFVVARVIVQNPLTRGKNFAVTQAAKDLLTALRFDEFQRAFGDSFVRGIQTGGEFFAIVRITSVSESTQTELAASLAAEANGLLASGSFKASFTKASSDASTRSEYIATMYQNAGSGITIAPTVEIGEVISRLKAFPEIAKNNPAAYETEVVTYDTIPLPLPTAEEREDFVFALADARERKLRYIQTRNDLEFALRNSAFFVDLPPTNVLQAAVGTYTQLINAVMGHAVRLTRGEITPPRIFDPAAVTPPIVEPAPITLRRAPGSPADLVEIPNMIGQYTGDRKSVV